MFIPLIPEIAVILLGMWLLGAATVNPVGRWRLRQGEEQHRSTTDLHPLVVVAFLLRTVLYGCQEKTPEPEKVNPTMTIENLQTAHGKELKWQQMNTAFVKQAEKERMSNVANLYRVAAHSEEIRAENHARLLRGHGVEPTRPAKDSVIVGKTLQTLKKAPSSEQLEIELLYPNLI